MKIQQLTSKDNALLKTIRAVSAGARRAPERLIAAEGIRVLEEVERSAHAVEAVVLSEDFGPAPRERDLLNAWSSKGIPLYQIKLPLFQSLSSVQSPQGAIALVSVPGIHLESIVPGKNALILCACGIQDPGNLGTLVRAAAAAGASLVCTMQGTVSPRNPKAIRSSAGSFFRLPVVEHATASGLRRYCDLHSIRLYRSDARKGVPYTEADLKSPCAIMMGNEGSGIPGEMFSDSTAIRIPIAEGIESLNVAVAGAVLLFEARRQRGEG